MKKNTLFIISFLFLLFSCSKSDETNSNIILVKKISSNLVYNSGQQGFNNSFTYIYDNNKIIKASTVLGNYTDNKIITYNQDLISKIEFYNNENLIVQTISFIYDNNKLITVINQSYNKVTTNYTYNIDGTITFIKTNLDLSTNITSNISSGKLIFSSGNLLKKVETKAETPDITETITFEYDAKNSPFKNVLGLNLILDNFGFIYAGNLFSSSNNKIALTRISTDDNILNSINQGALQYDGNNFVINQVINNDTFVVTNIFEY